MIGAFGAVVGAYGVFLLYTAALGWRGVGIGPSLGTAWTRRPRRADWLAQAGLADIPPLEFASVVLTLAVVGAALGLVLFGGPLPAIIIGIFAGTFPVAWYRERRLRRRSEAHEAWPRMLEELRLLTGSLGRSVPQALFEVGGRGPEELRPAFATAQREWLLSTDFAKTLSVLKNQLADVTADAVAETLLVAHQLGGTDLEHRLSALVDDRTADLQGRKDARAKQAGVRFVRRFVLFVPLGMALIGLSMGEGRSSYETELGQAGVALGVGVVIVCWVWAGHLLRLPDEDRVFLA